MFIYHYHYGYIRGIDRWRDNYAGKGKHYETRHIPKLKAKYVDQRSIYNAFKMVD